MEIWCNEAQERYVLVISEKGLETFERITRRERCPHAVIGRLTDDGVLTVHDAQFQNLAVDLPLDVLLARRRACTAMPRASSPRVAASTPVRSI